MQIYNVNHIKNAIQVYKDVKVLGKQLLLPK